jgi:hypothetical protein
MCLFMDMDKMVGGDFKKGLAAMKEVAEKEARGTPATESKPADAAQPTEPAAEPSADAAPSAEHATPANP